MMMIERSKSGFVDIPSNLRYDLVPKKLSWASTPSSQMLDSKMPANPSGFLSTSISSSCSWNRGGWAKVQAPTERGGKGCTPIRLHSLTDRSVLSVLWWRRGSKSHCRQSWRHRGWRHRSQCRCSTTAAGLERATAPFATEAELPNVANAGGEKPGGGPTPVSGPNTCAFYLARGDSTITLG